MIINVVSQIIQLEKSILQNKKLVNELRSQRAIKNEKLTSALKLLNFDLNKLYDDILIIKEELSAIYG